MTNAQSKVIPNQIPLSYPEIVIPSEAGIQLDIYPVQRTDINNGIIDKSAGYRPPPLLQLMD
jgi:hypothetical protein